MLSPDGLGSQIPGLYFWLPHGPSWVALGWGWENEQRKRMDRVRPRTGEVTGRDLGDSLFDCCVRRLYMLRIIFKHILISSVITSPRHSQDLIHWAKAVLLAPAGSHGGS